MFTKIIEVVRSIALWVAGLFRRRKRDGAGGELDDVARQSVNSIFQNRASFAVEIWREAVVGAPRQRFHLLRRGDSVSQETLTGHVWTSFDPASGLRLAVFEITTDSTLLAVDPDHLEMAAISSDQAALPETVEARFSNLTHYDIEIVGPGLEGGLATVLCPVGHTIGITALATTRWRAQTRAHDTGFGHVPDGLAIGEFLVGIVDVQHRVENTLIGFENRTMLTIECLRMHDEGAPAVEAVVGPMSFAVLSDEVVHGWSVRDSLSGVEILREARKWSPRTVEVVSAHLPRPRSDALEAEQFINNDLAIAVDVEAVDPGGAWRPLTTLLAGQQDVPTIVLQGGTLRAVEQWTRAVVGVRVVPTGPVDSDRQVWVIRAETAADAPSGEIAFSNETFIAATFVDLETLDAEPVAPHGVGRRTVPHGRLFAMCGVEPRRGVDGRIKQIEGVLAIGVGQRLQPMMRPTSKRLRSRAGGAEIDLTVEDLTSEPVTLSRVGHDGNVEVLLESFGGAGSDRTTTVRTRADSVLRLTRHGSADAVRELITTTDQPQSLTTLVASVAGGPETEIELVNRTLLQLDVLLVDTAGNEPNDPTTVMNVGDRFSGETTLGTSWIVRDRLSRAVVATFVVGRTTSVVDISSDDVWSHDRTDTDRSLTVRNTLVDDVSIQEYGSDRTVSEVGHLRAGEVTVLTVRAGRHLRAVAFEPQVTISERITADADGEWVVDLGFVHRVDVPEPTEDADDPVALASGQVAIYSKPKYWGSAVIVDRSIGSRQMLAELITQVGSVRLGPSTAATIRVSGTSGDSAVVISMDNPDVTASPLGTGSPVDLGIERIPDAKHLHISWRSHLVEDHLMVGESLTTRPAYRTIMTVPPEVTAVDLWADRTTTIRWQDTTPSIDADTPTRLTPNRAGKVMFAIDATDLSASSLSFRTNTMASDERLQIHPDATTHEKVAKLPDGALHGARDHLGINADIGEDQCAHVQAALQNLASTAQHSYTPTKQGIDHGRRIGPENMSHPHWSLDVGHDGASYEPLTHLQVNELHESVNLRHVSEEELAAGLFDIIGHGLESVAKVVVHTATKVATEVGHTIKNVETTVGDAATHIAKDVIVTAEHVGKDLVNGDLAGAASDLAEGTLSVGKDVVTGALHVGGDLVAGAAHIAEDIAEGAVQVVVATIHFADEAVQFVLTHTGIVGEIIGSILHKIGAAIEKAVSWLMNKLGMEHVWNTYREVVRDFGEQDLVQRTTEWVAPVSASAHHMFAAFRAEVDKTLDAAATSVSLGEGRSSSRPEHHSEVMDAIDWVLSHVFDNSSPTHPDPGSVAGSTGANLDGVHSVMTDHVGDETPGHRLIGDLVDGIETIVHDGITNPSAVFADLLEVTKKVADDVIDAAEGVFDEVLHAGPEVARTIASAAAATPLPVPIISQLFHAEFSRTPNVADITALAIAAPLTVLHHAETGSWPFDDETPAAAELPVLDLGAALLAEVYLIAHVFLAATSFVPKRERSSDIELTEIGSEATTETLAEASAAATPFMPPIVEMMEALLGVVVVMTSAPTSIWAEHKRFQAFSSSSVPELSGPDEWGDRVWLAVVALAILDWVRFAGAVADTRKSDRDFTDAHGWTDLAKRAQGVVALFQLAGVIVLAVAEAQKLVWWARPENAGAGSALELSESARTHYLEWGAAGVTAKTIANVADVIPPLVSAAATFVGANQTGVAKSFGSMAGKIGAVAHGAEAITVQVRIVTRGLY